MPQLTVRNLDDGIYEALKARAKRNHRSLEAEAREVLSRTARDEQRQTFRRWAAEMRADIGPSDRGDATGGIREDRDTR